MDRDTLELFKTWLNKNVMAEFGGGKGYMGILLDIKGQFCLINQKDYKVWVHYSHVALIPR